MSQPDLHRLALSLLAHLDREAEALEEVASALAELRRALLDSSLPEAESARERHAALAERIAALRMARERHVQAAAEALQVPATEFTVRALAARLPEELAGRLKAARERLRGLAESSDALARRTAALARHGLEFVKERLDEMSCVIVIGRYSASGKAVDPPRSSLIAVQG